MYLIIGLGNPTIKYKNTRHNAGFLIIEKLLTAYCLKLKALKNSNAKCAKSKIEGQDVIIAAPTTFMNESGLAVQAVASYFKVKPENIIIVHDDIDLPFGKIRLKKDGSAGGHNGLKSIIENLGTKNFIRLKVGIGPKPENLPSEKYVLQKFSKDEMKLLQTKIIPKTIEAIETILADGVEMAMNRYN